MGTLTGEELLTGFSTFLNDNFSSVTTDNGSAGGTTLVDQSLLNYQTNRLKGRWVRVTQSGSNQYYNRPIDTNSNGVATLTYPMPVQVSVASAYQIHRFDPSKKFRALDQARYDASDYVYQLIYDESLTADGQAYGFPIPENMQLGPIQVYEETPVNAALVIWNFITSPIGDSTDPWTATNCTPSIININYTDLLVPKYDYAATRLDIDDSATATYVQTVANMSNSITASYPAGRTMTYGAWVYSLVASRVRMGLTDDSGTTYSTYHNGLGWQLLYLEKEIDGTNATTLSAFIEVASGDATTIYWNRMWLYLGRKERITECYTNEAFPTIRRDATTQNVLLSGIPTRGHQLRFIGQKMLSELGTDRVTQTTNTMECDPDTAEMLYAKAAQILLEWEALTASDVPDIFTRIQTVLGRTNRVDKFRMHLPNKHVTSPYLV